jgi:hypothetical protein
MEEELPVRLELVVVEQDQRVLKALLVRAAEQ